MQVLKEDRNVMRKSLGGSSTRAPLEPIPALPLSTNSDKEGAWPPSLALFACQLALALLWRVGLTCPNDFACGRLNLEFASTSFQSSLH